MTDFYTVLRNALDRVGAGDDSAARDRVYAHVRDVMVRKLQGQEPPLGYHDIIERLESFDAAVARIEEEVAESVFAEPELAFAFADIAPASPPPASQPRTADRPPPEPPRPPEPAPAPDGTEWAEGDTAWVEETAEGEHPDEAWAASAIDLAWDETTAQWHDPSEVLPPGPPLPPGGWEERLGFAVNDDRGRAPPRTEPSFYEQGEWDAGDEPAADSAPAAERRRGLAGRLGAGLAAARGALPRRKPGSEAPAQSEPGRPAPAEPAAGYAPLSGVRFDTPRREQIDPVTAPPPSEPPADRAMLYLEDHSSEPAPLPAPRRGTATSAEPTLRAEPRDDANSPRTERRRGLGRKAVAESAEGPSRAGRKAARQEEKRARALEASIAADEDGEEAPRRSGRILNIAVGTLAIVVIAWCGYVFVPMLLPGGEAEVPTGTETAVATPADAVPPAAVAANAITLFDGIDPSVFEGGADNPVRYETEEAGPYVRLASSMTSSFRAAIGPGIAARLGGQEVTLVFDLRGAPARPSATLRVGYLRGNVLLDWRTIGLGTEFETARITWDIPPGPGNAPDYLIIEPGIPGDGTATDIRALRIETE